MSYGFDDFFPNECQVGLIEETGQATEPACHLLLKHAHDNFRLFCIGDHCQLGPFVNNPTLEDQLGISLFQRSFGRPHQAVESLTHQYRMPPTICRWLSMAFYDGDLVCGNGMTDPKLPAGMAWAEGKMLLLYMCQAPRLRRTKAIMRTVFRQT